ncbi:hypothetical protein CEXT_82221 [Caerostris extrusa]|uniref:Uncharacterized protein n=1 Tax=Caerostris extrusa TaxID=172846 RepID=A0AAV4QHW3_CAEEX|nr:hypothetical protein CEXT_82221 [Caerostris extrusa]
MRFTCSAINISIIRLLSPQSCCRANVKCNFIWYSSPLLEGKVKPPDNVKVLSRAREETEMVEDWFERKSVEA